MITQLALPMILRDDATFDNFYPGQQNQAVIKYLQNLNGQNQFIFLQGASGSGLTHLLQALCHVYQQCLYLPLGQSRELSPEILTGVEQLELVAIDDIDKITGQRIWEEAIFYAYNRLLEAHKIFIIASHMPIGQLRFHLPDLQSRLQNMLVLTVHELTDQEKIKALQRRAQQRGIKLSDDVSEFILRHASRRMQDLFDLLDKLDQISLREQRLLTIPFVKDVMKI